MQKIFIPLVAGIVLAVGVFAGLNYLYPQSTWVPGQPEVVQEDPHAYHVHSDFAVYIDGQKFNFAQEKYMTSTDVCHMESSTKKLHLHDMNGDVAHVHEAGHTWTDFFQSLGFEFTDTKLKTDDGKVFANTTDKKWRFFVNGKEISSLKDYQFHDLDQVLFTYGTTDENILQQQISAVTKKACIYSKTCPVPEGVILPPENCSS